MKFRNLLVGVIAGVFFFGCDKDSQMAVHESELPTLLPVEDVTVHPLGDEMVLSYTSRYDWEIDYDGLDNKDNWLTVKPEKGKAGTTAITVTVKPNLDGESDSTHVVFCSRQGDEIDKFKVTQHAAVLDVRISDASDYRTDSTTYVTFDWMKSGSDKGAIFEVESNIHWEIDFSGENSEEQRYLLEEDGKPVLSEKYGLLGDVPDILSFRLSAEDHNLNNQVFPAKITIRPRKVGLDGKDMELDESVSHALTRTIDVRQDFLLFYLEGMEGCELKEEATDIYILKKPFSELGYDYLTDHSTADTYPGEQYFYIVYEKDKVQFSDNDWDGLADGDELICEGNEELPYKDLLQSDTTHQLDRQCVRKKMRLVVPRPNVNKLPQDAVSDPVPTGKSLMLPLSVGNEPVDTICLDYSQNLYELELIDYNSDRSFPNLCSDNDKKTVKVRTKGPWKIDDGNKDWLEYNDSGHGTSDIDLMAPKQNLNFKENEAVLTLSTDFKANDPGISDDLHPKFTQKPFIFQIKDDRYDLENGIEISRLDTKPHNIRFESSGPWTLKMSSTDADDDWLNVGFASYMSDGAVVMADDEGVLNGGAGTHEIVMNAINPNEDKEHPRTMTVTITSDLHDGKNVAEARKNFSITQKVYCFDIDDSVFEKNIPAYKSDEYEFTIDCGAPWRVFSAPEWVDEVSVAAGDGTEGKVNITVTFKDNDGTMIETPWNQDRTGDIVIRSYKSEMTLPEDPNHEGEDKTITVTQDAFVFDVKTNPEYKLGALETDSQSFKIDCTPGAMWEISKSENWVDLSAAGGYGSASPSFSLKNNGNLEPRQATVTVSSTIVDKSVTFSVSQGAYRFDSTPVLLTEFGELDDTDRTLDIDCLGPWNVRNKPDWIRIDKMSGSGSDGKVSVRVGSEHNTGGVRSGSFEVYSNVGGVEHTKKISVNQKDFVWEIVSCPESISHDALKTDSYEMKFKCSGKWTAAVIGNEVKEFPVGLSDTEGQGGRDIEETLSFTVPENYKESERNVKVVITSNDDKNKTQEIPIAQKAYEFKVDVRSEECAVLGDSFTIPITCTGSWAVELDDAVKQYLDIVPMSGEGNGSVFVTVHPNYQPQVRKGSIKLVTTDPSELERTVSLSQKEYVFGLDGIPSDQFDATAQKFGFDVKCSGNWKVELDADAQQFITVGKNSGSGDDSLEFDIDLNKEAGQRSGNVTVSSTDNPELKRIVTVSQAGYVFVVDKDSKTVATLGETFDIGVTCTGGWTTELDSDAQDFLSVVPQSGSGNSTVKVKASLNKDSSARSGKITFTSTDNPAFIKTVTVSQDGYVWDAEPIEKEANVLGEEFTVDVTCTGGWKAGLDSDAQKFLSVVPQSGSGNRTVKVTASLNKESSARSGKITFTSTDNPAFTKTVTVSQAGYVWDATPVEKEANVLGEEFTVDVTCTGGWKAVFDTDARKFLTVDTEYGSGNRTVKVKASLNKESSARSGKIMFESTDNSDFTKIVTVSQDGYVWDAEPVEKEANVLGEEFTVDVTCTGGWKAVFDTDARKFLTVDTEYGSGNRTVKVKASLNKDSSARSGKITFTSTDNPAFTKTVTVSQKGYIFSVSPSQLNVPVQGDEYTVNVTCTGSWEAKVSKGTFFSVTKESEQKLKIKVDSNKLPADAAEGTVTPERDGEIKVSTTDGSELSLTIKVVQVGDTGR